LSFLHRKNKCNPSANRQLLKCPVFNQIKGKIEYHTEGAVFDDMKQWNPVKHPGNAAAAMNVEHVFSGAEKLI